MEKKITLAKRLTIFGAILAFALQLASKFPLVLQFVHAASRGQVAEAIGYLKQIPPEFIQNIAGFIHSTLKNSWALVKKTTYAFLVLGLITAAISRLYPKGKLYVKVSQCLPGSNLPAAVSIEALQEWGRRQLHIFKAMKYYLKVVEQEGTLYGKTLTGEKQRIITHKEIISKDKEEALWKHYCDVLPSIEMSSWHFEPANKTAATASDA